MKDQSLTQIMKDRGHGRLRAFITHCSDGFVAHIYDAGDDDTSHWHIKRRSPAALMTAMRERFLLCNKKRKK